MDSLPLGPLGMNYLGARTVSTGKDVYFTVKGSFYELTCDKQKTCNWYHMQQQLVGEEEEEEHVWQGKDEVMLLLPKGYSC